MSKPGRVLGRSLGNHSRVLVLSTSFGYGDDLMYFRPIFEAIQKILPRVRFAVDREYPTDRYSNLRLAPILSYSKSRSERLVSRLPGRGYKADRKWLPTLETIARIVLSGAECYVVVEFTPIATAGIMIAALQRRPLVLLIENDPVFRSGATGTIATRVKRFLANRATVVLTSNSQSGEYVTRDLKVPPSRVREAPYLTSEHDLSAIGKGAGRGRTRLLFVNSITQRKGLRQLLQAIRVSKSFEHDRIQLTVAGDGDDAASCHEIATELGLTEMLEFVGRQPYDNLGEFYGASDIVVNPTLADYRSLVGFESVLSRNIYIGSIFDGAGVELNDLRPAVRLVDPSNDKELAAAIDDAVTDVMRGVSHDAVFERARLKYAVDAIATNWSSAIHEAMVRDCEVKDNG